MLNAGHISRPQLNPNMTCIHKMTIPHPPFDKNSRGIWLDERISGIMMRILAILFPSFMISEQEIAVLLVLNIYFFFSIPPLPLLLLVAIQLLKILYTKAAPTTKRPWPSKNWNSKLPKIPPGHCEFLVLLEAKSWRIKASFPLFRAVDSAMVPLLVVAAASLESGSCEDCVGGKRVKRKVLSMRMIWLKLGLMLGSSTQHDCMMKARSGDISSGRAGLSCLKAAA